jgi:hypothetical protein
MCCGYTPGRLTLMDNYRPAGNSLKFAIDLDDRTEVHACDHDS